MAGMQWKKRPSRGECGFLTALVFITIFFTCELFQTTGFSKLSEQTSEKLSNVAICGANSSLDLYPGNGKNASRKMGERIDRGTHNSSLVAVDPRSLLNKIECDKPWVVETPEDRAFGRKNCVSDYGVCWGEFRNHIYGRTCQCGDKTLQYIEIPKTGSSSVNALMRKLCKAPCQFKKGYKHITEETAKTYTTFTLMRHPVERFISGYGTIAFRGANHRAEGILDLPENSRVRKMWEMDEPDRFHEFVNLFLETYDTLPNKYAPKGVLCGFFAHVLSQSFFWNVYPGDIHYTASTRNASAALNEMWEKAFGVQIHETIWANRDEGSKVTKDGEKKRSWKEEVMENDRVSIEKLNEFFKDEMETFGFEPL